MIKTLKRLMKNFWDKIKDIYSNYCVILKEFKIGRLYYSHAMIFECIEAKRIQNTESHFAIIIEHRYGKTKEHLILCDSNQTYDNSKWFNKNGSRANRDHARLAHAYLYNEEQITHELSLAESRKKIAAKILKEIDYAEEYKKK